MANEFKIKNGLQILDTSVIYGIYDSSSVFSDASAGFYLTTAKAVKNYVETYSYPKSYTDSCIATVNSNFIKSSSTGSTIKWTSGVFDASVSLNTLTDVSLVKVVATYDVLAADAASGQFINKQTEWYTDSSYLKPVDPSKDIQLGSIEIEQNSGEFNLINMNVTSGVASGTIESYSFNLDGSKYLTIYGESNGSGSIRNQKTRFHVPVHIESSLYLNSLQNVTALNILYFNPTTSQVTYGILPTGFIKDGSVGTGLYWFQGRFNAEVTKAYADSSLAARDSSIVWLLNNTYTKTYMDASLAKRDSSIIWLVANTHTKTYIDASLNVKSTISYVDASFAQRDSSIAWLLANVNTENYVDASLLARDVSIVWLMNNTYARTYIDSSFAKRDTSISWLLANTHTRTYIDTSLNNRDASIRVLWAYVDGSITSMDASIDWLVANFQDKTYIDGSLVNIRNSYLRESSLNEAYFKWSGGLLEPSMLTGGGDVTKAYVDVSLAERDSSITSLFSTKISDGNNIGTGDASMFSGITGTTMNFRTLIGSGAAIVTNTGDTITLSLDASFSGEVNTASNISSGVGLYKQKVGSNLEFKTLNSVNNTIALSADGSYAFLDVSISYRTEEYIDASLNAKTSFTYVDSSLSQRDSSISSLIGRINIADSSLNTLTLRHNVTETSVGVLTTRINNTDSSLNTLTLRHNVTETSVGQMYYKTYIDASLNAKTNFIYVDGSLAKRDSSITNLILRINITDSSGNVLLNRHDITESSVGLLTTGLSISDSSISQMYYKTYVDASLEAKTSFTYVDSSLGSKTSFSYVDSSLLKRDTSLSNLTLRANITDSSLSGLLGRHNITETSLGSLTTRVSSLESSVYSKTYTDASLSVKATYTYVDASLSVKANTTYVDSSLLSRDTSISSLIARLNITDSSLSGLLGRHNITETSLGSLTNKVNIIDSSLNTLLGRHNITETSLGSLTTRVSSLESSVYSKSYTDASLNAKTSFSYVDSSLLARDASITWLLGNKISNGSTIGSGDASIFYGVSGTSLQFRGISGTGAAIVTNLGDTIQISLDASFSGEVNTASNVGDGTGLFKQKVGSDLQFKTIKSSLNSIAISNDSSYVYLDTSISTYSRTYIDTSLLARDTSISNLTVRLNTTDSSLNNLLGRHNITETSLGSLTTRVVSLESSVYSKTYTDASLNAKASYIYVDASLNVKANITYIDSSLLKRDTSISDLTVRINLTDSSLNGLLGRHNITETSLGSLTTRVVSLESSVYSKTYTDASLSVKATYVYVDASLSVKANTTYVDSSLLKRDTSISDIATRVNVTDSSLSTLLGKHNITETSLGSLTTKVGIIDSSLNTLLGRHNITETSLGSLTIRVVSLESSVYSKTYLDASLNAKTSFSYVDSSLLKRDTSISDIATRVNVTDSSLSTLLGKHNITETSLGSLTTKVGIIDSSLNTLLGRHNITETSLGSLTTRVASLESSVYSKTYIDGSLNAKTGFTYVDSSLFFRLKEASLNMSTFKWVSGKLEPSTAGTVSMSYVDSSFAARDSSIAWLMSNSALNIWDVSSDGTTVYLVDPSDNLSLSYIELKENGGTLLFVDMPCSSVASLSEQSYDFRIDGSSALKIYGVGAGSVLSQTGVIVNANYQYMGDPSNNGTWRFGVDASGDLLFEKKVAGVWTHGGKFTV